MGLLRWQHPHILTAACAAVLVLAWILLGHLKCVEWPKEALWRDALLTGFLLTI